MPVEMLPPLPEKLGYIFSGLVLLFFLGLIVLNQRQLSGKRKKLPALLLPIFLLIISLVRFTSLYKRGEIYGALVNFIIPALIALYLLRIHLEEGRKKKTIGFISLEGDKELHPLFIKEGIEIGNEPLASDFIKILAYKKDGDYLAGASLGRRGQYLVVDAIAVDSSLQGRGIGRALMEELLDQLPLEEDIFLMAQQPGFFRKLGFEDIALEDCPPVFGCSHCERAGVDCFPQAMVLKKGTSLVKK